MSPKGMLCVGGYKAAVLGKRASGCVMLHQLGNVFLYVSKGIAVASVGLSASSRAGHNAEWLPWLRNSELQHQPARASAIRGGLKPGRQSHGLVTDLDQPLNALCRGHGCILFWRPSYSLFDAMT